MFNTIFNYINSFFQNQLEIEKQEQNRQFVFNNNEINAYVMWSDLMKSWTRNLRKKLTHHTLNIDEFHQVFLNDLKDLLANKVISLVSLRYFINELKSKSDMKDSVTQLVIHQVETFCQNLIQQRIEQLSLEHDFQQEVLNLAYQYWRDELSEDEFKTALKSYEKNIDPAVYQRVMTILEQFFNEESLSQLKDNLESENTIEEEAEVEEAKPITYMSSRSAISFKQVIAVTGLTLISAAAAENREVVSYGVMQSTGFGIQTIKTSELNLNNHNVMVTFNNLVVNFNDQNIVWSEQIKFSNGFSFSPDVVNVFSNNIVLTEVKTDSLSIATLKQDGSLFSPNALQAKVVPVNGLKNKNLSVQDSRKTITNDASFILLNSDVVNQNGDVVHENQSILIKVGSDGTLQTAQKVANSDTTISSFCQKADGTLITVGSYLDSGREKMFSVQFTNGFVPVKGENMFGAMDNSKGDRVTRATNVAATSDNGFVFSMKSNDLESSKTEFSYFGKYNPFGQLVWIQKIDFSSDAIMEGSSNFVSFIGSRINQEFFGLIDHATAKLANVRSFSDFPVIDNFQLHSDNSVSFVATTHYGQASNSFPINHCNSTVPVNTVLSTPILPLRAAFSLSVVPLAVAFVTSQETSISVIPESIQYINQCVDKSTTGAPPVQPTTGTTGRINTTGTPPVQPTTGTTGRVSTTATPSSMTTGEQISASGSTTSSSTTALLPVPPVPPAPEEPKLSSDTMKKIGAGTALLSFGIFATIGVGCVIKKCKKNKKEYQALEHQEESVDHMMLELTPQSQTPPV